MSTYDLYPDKMSEIRHLENKGYGKETEVVCGNCVHGIRMSQAPGWINCSCPIPWDILPSWAIAALGGNAGTCIHPGSIGCPNCQMFLRREVPRKSDPQIDASGVKSFRSSCIHQNKSNSPKHGNSRFSSHGVSVYKNP